MTVPETAAKTENGIVIVTGSNGTIGDAVMRRFTGRFDDVVGFDRYERFIR
jgi:nucleoside-diphosphate-sugar epimerase